MTHAPAIKIVETGEHKVADCEEVSGDILEFKVQEHSFTIAEVSRTAEDHGMAWDVWIVRIGVAQVNVGTVSIHKVKVTQADCKQTHHTRGIHVLYSKPVVFKTI